MERVTPSENGLWGFRGGRSNIWSLLASSHYFWRAPLEYEWHHHCENFHVQHKFNVDADTTNSPCCLESDPRLSGTLVESRQLTTLSTRMTDVYSCLKQLMLIVSWISSFVHVVYNPHLCCLIQSFALFFKWPMYMVVLTFLMYLCLGNTMAFNRG